MFSNFLKITFRNLRRNKIFSFINILGLATGLASCLLIILYIADESRYDTHHKNNDRLYRIASRSSKGETWAATAAPMAEAVKRNLPQVETATRLFTFPDIAKILIQYRQGDSHKKFVEENGYYVDSTFFDVLTYDFIYGNAQKALTEPNSIVISQTMSKKFFGEGNPVGKILLVNTAFGEFNYTVKGVFNETKYPSHIPANYFLSMQNNDLWHWVQIQRRFINNNVFFTYVKLKPGADTRQFQKQLQSFFDREAGEDMKSAGFSLTLFLQPVKDIYLRSNIGNEIAKNGNITYLYILGSIAAFMLVIACINFINLSTARSEKRAKEVGVKKVIGVERAGLIWQFLGESFIMSLLSVALAVALVEMALPFFNNLTQKNIRLFNEPLLFVWVTGLAIVTGVLAGLYPAFYLSAFRPAAVLKGNVTRSFTAATLRKGLVVFQFAISICLVFATLVIHRQLDYIKNRDLGFNKSQKLILPLQEGYLNSENNFSTLKNELLKHPEITAVTSASSYPGIVNLSDMLLYADGKTKADNVDVHINAIEPNFMQTLGIPLLQGRTFYDNNHTDSTSVILNETAIKQLGLTTNNAIGKTVKYDIGDYHGALQIIGVVKDFNFESLHNRIEPFGFTHTIMGNRFGFLIVSVQSANYAPVLKKIQQSWSKLFPNNPFKYTFLDQDFQRNYEKEQRTSGIIEAFTSIAILIACLGLFGLSAFSAEQRIKEIGIRKVLGASSSEITLLLSKNFLTLVGIAIVIALPAGWYMMNQWLQAFAYRATVSWWLFAVSAVAAILVALATISFQSVKAAIANPIKSLRTE